MRTRRKPGFTLIELSIYASLLGVFLLAIYGVFVASMRYFSLSQLTNDIQLSAQRSVRRMVDELSDSTLLGLKLFNTSSANGVLFLSARNQSGRFVTDASGTIVWQKWICYYSDTAQGTIVRKELAITPSTTPPSSSSLTLATFQSMAGGTVIAPISTQPVERCTAFSVTNPNSANGALTINTTFQATGRSNAANTTDARINVIDTFNVRN